MFNTEFINLDLISLLNIKNSNLIYLPSDFQDYLVLGFDIILLGSLIFFSGKKILDVGTKVFPYVVGTLVGTNSALELAKKSRSSGSNDSNSSNENNDKNKDEDKKSDDKKDNKNPNNSNENSPSSSNSTNKE